MLPTMFDIEEVISNKLYRSCRPGYPSKEVTPDEVENWIKEAKENGIKTILCFLNDDQLPYYEYHEVPLLEEYKKAGFKVIHHPVQDHLDPPLSPYDESKVKEYYQTAEKPLLIHCSAGIDRTGMAIDVLTGRKVEY